MSTLSELLPRTVDGLIFSAQIVPPVLDGSKTVTRRMSQKWMKRRKGDLIWVRETFTWVTGNGIRPWYRADGEPVGRDGKPLQWQAGPRWHPSIHMPRRVSRCVLRLTEDPRLERVQEITERDAEREGVGCIYGEGGHSFSHGFRETWTKLHTKPGERWEDNPLVVRLAFERAA